MRSTAIILSGVILVACAAPASLANGPGQTADAASADADSGDAAAADELAVADSAPPDVAAPAPDVVGAGPKPWPKGLHGKKAAAPVALPALTQVVASTGASVMPDDLKGHWSVLWFYPLAGTSG